MEFSPLGQTFSTGLAKTAQGYQEEHVIKLLKDISDGLAGGIEPREPRAVRVSSLGDPNNDDYNYDDYIPNYNDNRSDDRPYEDDNIPDEDDNMPDLETEEEAAETIADSCYKIIKKFKK